MSSIEERFWSKVNKTDSCWLWTGKKGRYGQFRLNGGIVGAHRVSWELANGPIPNGLLVCHSCDVPLCVNPAHLFLGRQGDNMQDMMNKDRHPRRRLSDQDRVNIRERVRRGEKQRSLAREYNVSEAAISMLVNWKYGI